MHINIDSLDDIDNFKSIKNLIFKKFIDYNKIPKILRENLILLMPYQKKNFNLS